MKHLALLAYTLMGLISTQAAPITPKQAQQNASQFATQHWGHTVALIPVHIGGINKLYIYNIVGGGFVVASNDDRTLPVLGYSRTGRITQQTINPNLRYWLNQYENQISQLGNTTLQQLQESYQAQTTTDYPDSVPALVTSQWTQSGAGYNSLVPEDHAFESGHPTVGCGALAMAQIMRYWQYPQHGFGQHSYTYTDHPCWQYGTVSADFQNTTYDYANMPNRLDSNSTSQQINAVATLLFHCGVAANMDYNSDCYGSSGSTINNASNGLVRYFHYQNDCHIEMKFNHSNTTWTNLLKADLSAGRPVFYCGQSFRDDSEGTLDGGHAFVCDGYDSQDYFHFNWGWGGYSDGYFALNVLRPMTAYNFTSYQYALFNLHPATHAMAIMAMASDLTVSRNSFGRGIPVEGGYSITNLGDTILDIFVGVNVYGSYDNQYKGCLDGRRIVVQPGDTARCHYSYDLSLPTGSYQAVMQYSPDTFYAGIADDRTLYLDDGDHSSQAPFSITDEQEPLAYKNLVLFLQFADDGGFVNNVNFYDRLFNTGDRNVANFYQTITYNNLTYNSIFPTSCSNNVIVPYTDIQPRGYFQPVSASNPIGYVGPNPLVSISQREAELIARLCHYVDSLHLVPDNEILDANGDGDIDNVSIIVSGETGNWADLLWPHMEFFPHDSIGHVLTINGKRVNCFNFEFDNAPNYTTLRTFCHEMGHSLGLPDLYHYEHYTDVWPASYDLMGGSFCHPSAIYKNQILHVSDNPIEITTDGTYTINSNGSSPQNNLYFIRSAIDSNQLFTIEYRYAHDPYEESIPQSGLLMGRWMDTVTRDIYNAGDDDFDDNTKPNTYWVFRPNSHNDTEDGIRELSFFSHESGRDAFGPTTDPHPYLSDGTPETSFEIYDIRENGTTCSFSVRFLNTQSINTPDAKPSLTLSPNPAVDQISLTGIAPNTPIRIYNMVGSRMMELIFYGTPIQISQLSAGVYILSTPEATVKFVKK